jgi:hypothetical protein
MFYKPRRIIEAAILMYLSGEVALRYVKKEVHFENRD